MSQTTTHPQGKLTSKDKKAIVKQFKKGDSILQIARDFEVSQSTIRYWVKRLVLGERSVREWNLTDNPQKKARRQRIENARADFRKGMSVTQIAAKYDWGLSTTYRHLEVAPDRKPTSKWIGKALADLDAGMSVSQIAKKYKRAHSTVSGSLSLRLGKSVQEWKAEQGQG